MAAPVNRVLQSYPLRLAVAAIVAASIALIFLPPPTRNIPAPITVEAPLAISLSPLSAEQAESLFDLASLPVIEVPPPPPVIVDPAAALKRHTLLGVSLNETGAIALISDGVRQLSLKEGGVLAGFEVIRIWPRQVDFEKDGTTVSLSLPDIGIDASE